MMQRLIITAVTCTLIAMTAGTPQARAQTINDGLVLHLTMDAKAGSTNQVKPTTYRGTMMGTNAADGRVEGAQAFNGKRSYIAFPARDFGDIFTIAMFVKPDEFKSGEMTLVSNRASADDDNGFSLGIKANGAITVSTGNGLDKTAFASSAGSIKFGQWNHIALMVDQQRRSADIYANAAIKVIDGDVLSNFVTDATWRIGQRKDSGSPFSGAIDDVRVYDVRLSGLVIRALSDKGESSASADSPKETAPVKIDLKKLSFSAHIAPILEARCVSCHNDKKAKGKLRLDRRSDAFKGGETGPAIVAGKSSESLLYELVALPADDADRMPSKGDPLTKDEVAMIKVWIDQQRARWPSSVVLYAPGSGKTRKTTTAAIDPTGSSVAINVTGITSFSPPRTGMAKRIDDYIAMGYRKKKIQRQPIANDEMYLRRTYLTVVGRIPTYAETRDFLDSDDPDKRSQLVDKLLDSPGYVSQMYNFWAIGMLRITRDDWDPTHRYAEWLKKSVAENKPYDKMVFEMLTAVGNPGENGAVGYFFRDRDTPLITTGLTARNFLGTSIECAQCHDHKFDHWKQKEFYEQAAFLGSIRNYRNNDVVRSIPEIAKRKGLELPENNNNLPIYRTLYYSNDGGRVLKFPNDYAYDDAKPGQVVQPRVIFEKPQLEWGTPQPKRGKKTTRKTRTTRSPGESSSADYASSGAAVMTKDARRIAFARWITSKDNPMFAKVMANRLWKRVMGIGLHEPIDDWKEGAEGINPALMKYLAGEFIRLKFDVKEFMRGLLKSGTYQAHAMGEQDLTTAKYAAQAILLRRMSAEQVFDSWLTLIVPELDARKRQPSPLETFLVGYQTGPRTAERAVDMMIKFKKGEYGNMMTRMRMTYPSGHKGMMRASEMLYPADYGSFMNIFGQSPREEVSGGSTEPGLQQVLFLLNGDMSYKVLGRDSMLRKNLDAAKSNVQKINILFLSILNRYPGAREMEVCRKEMETNGFDGVANIARALLNGREFLFIQ